MSYPSSHHYETIYVLRSGLSDADAGTIHQKVDNVITKFSGKLIGRDDWGLKELAYPINDGTSARYTCIQYSGNSGVVEEIERHFKISEDVIRFITVATPADYDYAKVKLQISVGEEEHRRNKEYREQRRASRSFEPRGGGGGGYEPRGGGGGYENKGGFESR